MLFILILKLHRIFNKFPKTVQTGFRNCAALQVGVVNFTLDGKPTENQGPLGRGKMKVSSVFHKGVWRAIGQMQGCPYVFVERRRIGDYIYQTKTCEGVTFSDIERKLR